MNERELFRFCACCPNPCRKDIPASMDRQVESETPSALSLIALAVIDGHLPYDADARAALSATEAAHACRPACPYGFDIAGAVDRLNQRLAASGAAP